MASRLHLASVVNCLDEGKSTCVNDRLEGERPRIGGAIGSSRGTARLNARPLSVPLGFRRLFVAPRR